MSDIFADYDGPQETSSMLMKKEESTIEKLERQSDELTDRLLKINRLKQLLKENPQFEELLNLTREVRLR
jgi:pantoate kinase